MGKVGCKTTSHQKSQGASTRPTPQNVEQQ